MTGVVVIFDRVKRTGSSFDSTADSSLSPTHQTVSLLLVSSQRPRSAYFKGTEISVQ
jgi:hypothetical protein